ncbi:adenylate/guanylate cyclase domain-containing protein [Rhodococcus rhodnii]|uniref:adenylate/guanylate cyclase domain-containing protein n=1 Tax=Rhodococcus rhodnii TaxID=38312 RepID=UPI003531643E
MEPEHAPEDEREEPPTSVPSRVLARLGDLDRNPRFVGGVRRMRRALPGDPGFGDPLSTAGPGSARAVARIADRLTSDRAGVSKEASLGALQVWQAALERIGRGRGTAEVTIVFTDLVAFSTWSLDAGDASTLQLLRDVARAVEPPMQQRGGQIVKRMGDGLMAAFVSPDRAVDAVFDARDRLSRIECDGYRPHMRVGMHTGLPRRVGDDWLGVDVTIAARMMGLAGSGDVVASSATLDGLDADTLANLSVRARPWRRGLFASVPRGVPSDLGIWRLTRS